MSRRPCHPRATSAVVTTLGLFGSEPRREAGEEDLHVSLEPGENTVHLTLSGTGAVQRLHRWREGKDIDFQEEVGLEVPKGICEQLSNSQALAGPQGGPCLLDIREPKGQNRKPNAGSLMKGHRVG